MKIENILYLENELMDAGDLDEQIMHDFKNYIKGLEDYQKNHLDAIVKEQKSNNYEYWTMRNQSKIAYAKRIIECVEAMSKIEEVKEEIHELIKKDKSCIGIVYARRCFEILNRKVWGRDAE